MRRDRAVGAHRDLDTRLGGQPERVELRTAEPPQLLAYRGLHLLVVRERLGRVAGR